MIFHSTLRRQLLPPVGRPGCCISFFQVEIMFHTVESFQSCHHLMILNIDDQFSSMHISMSCQMDDLIFCRWIKEEGTEKQMKARYWCHRSALATNCTRSFRMPSLVECQLQQQPHEQSIAQQCTRWVQIWLGFLNQTNLHRNKVDRKEKEKSCRGVQIRFKIQIRSMHAQHFTAPQVIHMSR